MPKYTSGRVPVNGPGAARSDRHTFLSIEDAEPNLGLASSDNSVITTQSDGTRGITDTPTVAGVNATGIITATTGIVTSIDAENVDAVALYAQSGIITTLTATDIVGTALSLIHI